MNKVREIKFAPPDITSREINEVVKVLKSGWITTGPKTKEFEKKIADYVGVRKAVCLNSATAAMELSLHLLGVGPGDEVITSAYTYTASASVIMHVGAKIVLVDINPESYEMDYNQLESAVTTKTKVIIPVDIAGVMCDYDRINEIVERKKHMFLPKNERQKSIGRITVLADAAHSFGATRNGKISGQAADITCFSFHAVKNLTTGEGGAVVWTNNFGLTEELIYKEFMLYSLHGQTKDAYSKTEKGTWEYDIKYPAYKCNMTDIVAAIGVIQLERYDVFLSKRFKLITLYRKLLNPNELEVIKHSGIDFKSSGHLLLCRFRIIDEGKRNELINYLATKGISTNVHYKPLPMLQAYKCLGFEVNDYPNSYQAFRSEITLPLHTRLSVEDVRYICNHVNKFIGGEVI